MRQHSASPVRATQFDLFRSRPQVPHWTQLPPEVRQHTLRLLARLLRQHRQSLLGITAAKEVRDE